ncbi:MAG: hypothetical protein QM727_02870 [Niabella sp.]
MNESAVIPVEVSSTGINQFPEKAAVFILKEDNATVYVSETENLKNKMAEFVSTKRLNDDINGLLNDIIAKYLKLSYLLVDLGRKELEERISKKVSTLKRKPILKPKNSRRIKTLTNAGRRRMMKNWNYFFVKGKP